MALQLPASLKLKRDKKSEKLLIEASRKWLEQEERSPGIHASGLLDPRKTYWQHEDPKPISDRLVTIFLIGKLLHAFILSALAGAKGVDWSTDTGSKTSAKLKIQYSMDYVHKGVPTELKTSRSPFEPTHLDDVANYAEQVLIYSTAEDKLVGNLWILYLNLRNKDKQTEPGYRCYKLSMTKADKQAFEKQLIQTRESIETAIATKDHKALPMCRTWICGEKQCEWWEKCQPEGRYGIKKKGDWAA